MFASVRETLQHTVLRRNEPAHPRAAFPQTSERYEVGVRVEEAPKPVPQTAYYGIGRDAAHATPHQWRYTSLAIPEWLSVMGWPFAVPKVPSALVVSMPQGRQNPLRERTNITSPKQSSLGSMTAVDGVRSWSTPLAKITF